MNDNNHGILIFTYVEYVSVPQQFYLQSIFVYVFLPVVFLQVREFYSKKQMKLQNK